MDAYLLPKVVRQFLNKDTLLVKLLLEVAPQIFNNVGAEFQRQIVITLKFP